VRAQWAPEPVPARAPRARWAAALLAGACFAAIALVLALSAGGPSPRAFTRTLRVPPAAQASASVAVLQHRVEALGLRGWSIESRGDRIRVSCTGCSPALVRSVTQPGELRIYDWEANVLDARCRPDPAAEDVTSGAAAGRAGRGSLTHAAAARRAAGCPGSRLVRSLDPAFWYVLRDRPAVTGREVADARLAHLGGEPAVTLRFTPAGQRRWDALTRRVAQRGRRAAQPGGDPVAAAQHVAIVLDHRVLVEAYINPRLHPRGLVAEIAGGLTDADARTLVALLKSGALPATAAP
jgi:preprotein translocase subunit SecD